MLCLQLPVNVFEDEFEAYDEVDVINTSSDHEENEWAVS